MSLENTLERIAVALELIAAYHGAKPVSSETDELAVKRQTKQVEQIHSPEVFKFDAEAYSLPEMVALVVLHGHKKYTEAHITEAQELVNGDTHSNNSVFVEELISLLDVTQVKKMNNAAKMVIGQRVLEFWSIDDKAGFVQKLAKTKAAERSTTEPDADLADIETIDFVALRADVRTQVLELTKTNRDDVIAALKTFKAAGLKDVKDEDLLTFKGLLDEIK